MNSYIKLAFLCFAVAAVIFLLVIPFMKISAEAEYKAHEYCATHDTPQCREWLDKKR